MNSSENFASANKHLAIYKVRLDKSHEFREEPAGTLVIHAPPWAPRSAGAKPAWSESLRLQDGSNYNGAPPLTPPVTSGEYDPKSIRFIDGPDTALRRTKLCDRMREVSADGAFQLLVESGKGVVSVRLDRAAASETASSAAKAHVVVGIDGVEQFLASPGKIACHIKSLTNINVTVICSIDSRCCDWLLLVFHLRILGLKVVQEKLAASVYLERSLMKRYLKSTVALRSFPVKSTREQGAFSYRLRKFDDYIETVSRYLLKAPSTTEMSSRQVAARNATWQATTRRDGVDCARAIRKLCTAGQRPRARGYY